MRTVFKRNMDLILAKVVTKQSEVTMDLDGYTDPQIRELIQEVQIRGFHATFDGRYLLIRDLR